MTQTINIGIIYTANYLPLHEQQTATFQRSKERIISEAVDESLSSFGDQFKQLVYSQLEKVFEIKRQEIPFKINEFADAIEVMFGQGAKLIEMRIIQTLHEKAEGFMYFPKSEDLMFTEYIDSMPCHL